MGEERYLTGNETGFDSPAASTRSAAMWKPASAGGHGQWDRLARRVFGSRKARWRKLSSAIQPPVADGLAAAFFQ